MKLSVLKLTWRSIRSFGGRYMALLLIVALSAGFFAGLKISRDAMSNTCQNYLEQQCFYDFRLLSTLGFSEADVEAVSQLPFVERAEGTKSMDTMVEHGGSITPFTLIALPQKINLPSLTAGRQPETDNECLADAKAFDETDIGTQIRLADESVTGQISGTEYTIVGLVNSPLYLSDDRGTTRIGSGSLEGFLYLPADCFITDACTGIDLTLKESAAIYSAAYDRLIETYGETVTEAAKQRVRERYDSLSGDSRSAAQYRLEEPEAYVLTRSENVGYISFENDTSIVSGIANIFPVFFILIAMLVCVTTMTRMVNEERTQIGVLKAMGFGNGTIMAKYLLYAGSAALLGWGSGYFLGTWGLPKIFWLAYSSLYHFAPLPYLFDPSLALLTLVVSLAGILSGTLIACRKELGSVPAKLIRRRAAKKGKRILLERITLVWGRLSFLQKVTLRNLFRYKSRFIMMLAGISCCTGLVVTAFGVRDSMIGISSLQFGGVQCYDMEAAFADEAEADVCEMLDGWDGIDRYLMASVQRVNLHASGSMNSVNLYSFSDTVSLSKFWNFHAGEEKLGIPRTGEAIISCRAAEKLELSPGDQLEICDADMEVLTVTVSGIFDNYVDNFVIISADTFSEAFGVWKANTVLLSAPQDTQKMAEELAGIDAVTSVKQLTFVKEGTDSALSCLNGIIWLIVLFSGALAFIVIYNLTNINLAERSREIATVEVLGFYPQETESYVLRENLIFSVLSGLLGLLLGTLLHRFVMKMIVIDSLAFDIHITGMSYGLAFICTVLFAVVVNQVMKRQLSRIPMAESLKETE